MELDTSINGRTQLVRIDNNTIWYGRNALATTRITSTNLCCDLVFDNNVDDDDDETVCARQAIHFVKRLKPLENNEMRERKKNGKNKIYK